MPEPLISVSPPLVAVALVGLALVVGVGVWLVRRARRSPRAWRSARREVTAVGRALVELDDAVVDFEVEAAVTGGMAPDESLRRARMAAQHDRDRAFAAYRALPDEARSPADLRRGARIVRAHVVKGIAEITGIRDAHRTAVIARATPDALRAEATERLDRAREGIGDPDALVDALRSRFDAAEWRDAADAALRARSALARAEERLRASDAEDVARVWADAVAAEHATREAEADARRLEQLHRVTLQSAHNVAQELEDLRGALRETLTEAGSDRSSAARRVASEVPALAAAADALAPRAAVRPTAAVDEIARLRGALDRCARDARSAPQRMRAARSALPGTLAAARAALVHADARVGRGSADARVRLAGAERELARAGQAGDPVAAISAARRALRLADDAVAPARRG